VAVALVGGATAEQVARQRGVSLMTACVQIRPTPGKSACENRREPERQLVTLAAHVPQCLVAGAQRLFAGDFFPPR
jgi:hypothetical protein